MPFSEAAATASRVREQLRAGLAAAALRSDVPEMARLLALRSTLPVINVLLYGPELQAEARTWAARQRRAQDRAGAARGRVSELVRAIQAAEAAGRELATIRPPATTAAATVQDLAQTIRELERARATVERLEEVKAAGESAQASLAVAQAELDSAELAAGVAGRYIVGLDGAVDLIGRLTLTEVADEAAALAAAQAAIQEVGAERAIADSGWSTCGMEE